MLLNGVGVGRFVTNDCWKRGGVFYLFFKEGSVGVGVGRFVINDCWKRGGVFYLFFNLLDLIEKMCSHFCCTREFLFTFFRSSLHQV